MNGLAVCCGVGGLELGLKLALGAAYRTVGYIEREAFAAATLVARMEGSALDRAPVWDDVATFDGRAWRGRVDLISAGIPCQPASVAGRRLGTGDERWLWPHVAKIIRDVAPRAIYLENVRGLLSVDGGAAFAEVLTTLASLGLDAEWDVFSASEVGASHRRARLFLLAYRHGQRGDRLHVRLESRPMATVPVDHVPDVADPDGDERCEAVRRQPERGRPPASGTDVGDAVGPDVADAAGGAVTGPLAAPFPPGPDDSDGWRAVLAERPSLAPALEPGILRVADGLAHRVDRLRAIGNGVVPLVAAVAFLALASRAGLITTEADELAA